MNIAFCFNNEKDAKLISTYFSYLAPQANFIFAANLELFLKEIAKKDMIDCFVIEENLKECSFLDFIEKLKKSRKYKKSAIVAFTSSLREMGQQTPKFNVDLVFDTQSNSADICTSLRNILIQKQFPVIPESYNVLVLDDDEQMLELISMHLEELGHKQIKTCTSITEAKDLLSVQAFDLLLLDWNLADGTCIDLIEYIKMAPLDLRTKEATVVVITGRDTVDDIITLLRYGIKDHIIKPFYFDEFEEKISYAIERRAQFKKNG